jgi:tetratricopeptide (TPR) repeat protein
LASIAHNEPVLLFADEGDFDRAAEHAARARELALASHDDWLLARVSGVQGYVMSERGEALSALDLYDVSAEGFARAGDRRREAIAKANAGDALLEMGRLVEARELLVAAVEGSRKVGNDRTVAVASANLASLERLDGAFEAAAATLEKAASEAQRLGHGRLMAAVTAERILLRLATDAPPEALRAAAAEASSVRAKAPSPLLALFLLGSEARARHGLGESAEHEIAALREGLAAESPHPQFALAARVALYVVAGQEAADAEHARELLAGIVSGAADDRNRDALRRAVVRRYLVPRELTEPG